MGQGDDPEPDEPAAETEMSAMATSDQIHDAKVMDDKRKANKSSAAIQGYGGMRTVGSKANQLAVRHASKVPFEIISGVCRAASNAISRAELIVHCSGARHRSARWKSVHISGSAFCADQRRARCPCRSAADIAAAEIGCRCS